MKHQVCDRRQGTLNVYEVAIAPFDDVTGDKLARPRQLYSQSFRHHS